MQLIFIFSVDIEMIFNLNHREVAQYDLRK